jgi:hypothetical protein
MPAFPQGRRVEPGDTAKNRVFGDADHSGGTGFVLGFNQQNALPWRQKWKGYLR